MATVSKFAILTNILLASGVLAVPSSPLEDRLAHLREHRRSKLVNRDGAVYDYNGNWAGAALTRSEGSFNSVTGTFTIPTLTGSDCSATAWVGIDGPVCRNAILQAGVDLVILEGKLAYNPWVEWYPDGTYYFSGFNVSAGDEIRATVTSSSQTSGMALLENLTTHKKITKQVSSSYPLCGADAEWVIEDFMQDVPFAGFGTVKFTNATASGPGNKSYTPDGADIIFDIQRDNATVLTSVSVSGNTVSIKRV